MRTTSPDLLMGASFVTAVPASSTALPPFPGEGDDPTPEFLAELAEQSQRLESATPQEIIAWAAGRYFPKLTMATAFGPEGCCILQMLSEINPQVHVFNLDTGYPFQE